jgi:hypothetical protein
LNSQEPAEQISKIDDSYTLECLCTCEDHSVTIVKAYADADFGICLYFRTSIKCKNIWNRIKVALSVLIKGDYVSNSETLLSPQGAINLAKTLEKLSEEE